ncbi:class I SAM-dependent methyltransferase [uncultured Nocardioides sp.]|uniref:class I SAM-dependent methyltransferase n=1 Tax=uncultured Nocardioides sp. TaxID=198441 RepID=UPI0026214D66|nr:class I SAM-dependent methyltransferase [uncultured Nocardioides sp.]
MTDLQPGADPRSCFGSVADAYDRGRPSYPTQAAAWLVGEQPATVLELGAGTGKLTEVLVGLGHEVHATDPDAAMLERLRARLPLVRASVAGAEDIPLGDGSVDVVVAGQAFHWFDMERALPEINRVLRPGGHLALVWNQRDERVPWVRRLGALLGDQDQRTDLADPVEASGLFGWVEEETFKHRQVIDRESVLDLALSRSNIATLDEHRREAKLAEVRAFYDDYGRGMDGMQLPYLARCYRARMVEQERAPRPTSATTGTGTPEAVAEPAPEVHDSPMLVTTGSIPRIDVEVAKATPSSVLDDDTAMLLIDFR